MSLHSRDSREHFRNIKAIFEGFNVAPISPPRTRPGSPINRSYSHGSSHMRSRSYTNNPVAQLERIAREQEDVPVATNTTSAPYEPHFSLQAPASSPAPGTPTASSARLLRPGLASAKPSWVGPQTTPRPATPGIMAQRVPITYSSPGLQPPVFITTSLSEPQWEVLEMGVGEDSAGNFEFTKVFHARPGEYQYKFRLGPGDWWVCDEEKEVVDDGMGNQNNHITVAEPSLAFLVAPQHEPPTSQPLQAARLSEVRSEELQRRQDPELIETKKHLAPLLPHESAFGHVKLELPTEDVPVLPSKPRQDTIALPDNGDPEDEGYDEPATYPASPLFRHETGFEILVAEIADHTPGVDEDEDHLDLPEHKAPLLSHETYLPTPSPQIEPPSAFPKLTTGQLPAAFQSVVPDEADPNDKSLEHFPTTPEAIVHHIRRLSNHMPEDEVTELSLAGSPSTISLPPMQRTTSQTASLPSVVEEGGEEHLQRPAAPYTPPKTPPFTAVKPHVSDHHHQKIAEMDMEDEAQHPVKLPHETDGGTEEEPAVTAEPVAQPAKASGNSWEAMLGLALFVFIGALAAWLAIKVQGVGRTVKDGGATIAAIPRPRAAYTPPTAVLAPARPLEQRGLGSTEQISFTPKKRKLAPFSKLSSSSPSLGSTSTSTSISGDVSGTGIGGVERSEEVEFDTGRWESHQRQGSAEADVRESVERPETASFLGSVGGLALAKSEECKGESPSGAFAGISISGEMGEGSERASSPVKERGSSPAKRTAGEMEEEEQTDFDMAIEELRSGDDVGKSGSASMKGSAGDSGSTSATSVDDLPPAYDGAANEENLGTDELDRRVGEVQRLAQEPLNHGERGMIVSTQWLARVLSRTSEKLHSNDFPKEARQGPIGRVDNSNIVPANGFAQPILKDVEGHLFTPLKPGSQMGDDFEVLPYPAWQKIVGWYGLVDGQREITRYAYDTAQESGRSNVIYECHPPVFTVRRVPQPGASDESADENRTADSSRSAANALRLKNERKQRGQMSPDDALKIVSSRQEGYQKFLKRTKQFAGIPLARKVKVWRVLNPTDGTAVDAAPTATEDATVNATKLTVNPTEWQGMAVGKDLEHIDILDQTNNANYNGKSSTMELVSLFEEQIGGPAGGEFDSDSKKRATIVNGRIGTVSKPVSAAPSGRSSPAPGGAMTTRGRTRRDGRTKGTVGLGNLGNTCYMNSALQCIRSVEELAVYFLQDAYKKEINADNPLGSGGLMAKKYGELLNNIYGDNSGSSYTPTNFKKTLSGQNPVFSGWGQQDSQEFLSYLIDAVHEDLNRIEKKPYFENPDSDDSRVNDPEYIKELGEIYQKHHDARNDSICMDLFSGFYKNTMECPVCNKVSVTFDPFSSLTLQLPMENTFNHTFTFVPLSGRPVNHDMDLEKSLTMRDVKERIAAKHPGATADKMWMVEVYNCKLYKHFDDRMSLAEANIQQADFIFVYELDQVAKNIPPPASFHTSSNYGGRKEFAVPDMATSEMAETFAVPIFHRKRDGRMDSWKSVMHPLYISLTREEAKDYDVVLKKVLLRVAETTSRPILQEMDQGETSSASDEEVRIAASGEFEGGNDEVAQVSDHSVPSEDGYVDISVDDKAQPAAVNGDTPTSPGLDSSASKAPKNFMDAAYSLSLALRNQLFALNYVKGSENTLCVGLNGFEDKGVRSMHGRVKVPVTLSSTDSASDDDEDTSTASSPANSGMADDSDDDADADEANAVPSTEESTLSLSNAVEDADDDDELPDNPLDANAKPGGRRGKENKFKAGSKKAKRKEARLSKKHQKRLRKAANGVLGSSQPQRETDDNPYYIQLGEGIVLDWYPEAFDSLFCGSKDDDSELRGHYTSHSNGTGLDVVPDPATAEKRRLRQLRQKNGITLEDCFTETGKREKLSADNAWYCNRCKELRQATKTLDIWTCPDIVVVHLKRFGGTRSFRDKLDVMVDYPIEGLDLTHKIGQKEDDKEYIYDLFAVDNHFGGLGGGHYTASAKNFFDGQWYDYNDSSCSKLGDAPRRSAAAYLLFYRRRSTTPLGPPYLQKLVEDYHNPPPALPAPSKVDVNANDEAYESDSGEGRLGDPTSILPGSSGLSYHGAGVAAATTVGSKRPLQSRSAGSGVGGVGAGLRAKPRSLMGEDDDEDEGISMLDEGTAGMGGKPFYGPVRPPHMLPHSAQGSSTWGFDGIQDDNSGAMPTLESYETDLMIDDADSTTVALSDRAMDSDTEMNNWNDTEETFVIGDQEGGDDRAQHIEQASDDGEVHEIVLDTEFTY
ncbi:hypothetical protein LTR95_001810 [Oleoguttula sp. CCFEE 5521]